MALVQVREVVRRGLVQNASRYISPPNSSSPASCLWKTDSINKKRRTLLMARMMEYRATFFSSQWGGLSGAAEVHTYSAAQMAAEETGTVTSTGTSSEEVDTESLDKSYGQEQADHKKVADDSHGHYEKAKDEGDSESLESTGFDISKQSRPSGDE